MAGNNKDWWDDDPSKIENENDSKVEVKQETPSTEGSPMHHLRELNDRFRSICEEGGKIYEEDAKDDDELCNRYREAVSFKNVRINNVFNKVKLTGNVDLCFVVDATGSMKSVFHEVKATMNRIVGKLINGKEENVKFLRFAMVAYRDFDYDERFNVLDFTSSIDEFREFCGKVVTIKSDKTRRDDPEDVFGGLNEAFKLSWNKEKSGTKLIFHICDFPCHGKDFHSDTLHDNYPGGDIYGLSHDGIFSQLCEKGIQYTFGKITKQTDIMLKKFSEVYKDTILTFDIKKVTMICKAVVRAVKGSVLTSIDRATSTTVGANGEELKERKFVLNTAEPNWDELEHFSAISIAYEHPKSIDDIVEDVPLKQNKPKSVQVKFAGQPFSRGRERIAYYGRFIKFGFKSFIGLSSPKEIVLKEYIYEYSGKIAKRFEDANKVQTVASFLAKRFCEECRKNKIDTSIEFLETKTLEIKQEDGTSRYMTCEDRFEAEAKFVRFSNNTGYQISEEEAKEHEISMEYVELLMAFSHWTYKASGKFFMIVDLQGIVIKGKKEEDRIILTDPAIHSIDPTRFGHTNLASKGMKAFLDCHNCNKFCKMFGLDH